jgi:hypothetical protein
MAAVGRRRRPSPNDFIPTMNPHRLRSPALTIVTGASDNHYACLKNLLFSLHIHESATPTVVYDLGLQDAQAKELDRAGFDLRRFPFEQYPPHVDIKVNCGEYAWKPIIVADVLAETGGAILWLDAGDIVLRPLREIRRLLATTGVYSPPSRGTVEKWTHPGTLAYLEVASDLLTKPNRNGAIVGIQSGHNGTSELAASWRRCALDPACIAPPGSNRKNHRQDQAVLTVLMYQFQARYGWELCDELSEVAIHMDRLSRSEIRKLLQLSFLSGRQFPLS